MARSRAGPSWTAASTESQRERRRVGEKGTLGAVARARGVEVPAARRVFAQELVRAQSDESSSHSISSVRGIGTLVQSLVVALRNPTASSESAHLLD